MNLELTLEYLSKVVIKHLTIKRSSQKRLGILCGLTQSTISKLETKNYRLMPPLNAFEGIAKLENIAMWELIREIELSSFTYPEKTIPESSSYVSIPVVSSRTLQTDKFFLSKELIPRHLVETSWPEVETYNIRASIKKVTDLESALKISHDSLVQVSILASSLINNSTF